jgi:hypothetical protein
MALRFDLEIGPECGCGRIELPHGFMFLFEIALWRFPFYGGIRIVRVKEPMCQKSGMGTSGLKCLLTGYGVEQRYRETEESAAHVSSPWPSTTCVSPLPWATTRSGSTMPMVCAKLFNRESADSVTSWPLANNRRPFLPRTSSCMIILVRSCARLTNRTVRCDSSTWTSCSASTKSGL